jgi:anti-anti-sigma factor
MVNVEKRNKVDVVTFSSEKINALVTDEVRTEIAKIFETLNAKVVIDLKGVQYIDSSGFGCLLSIMKTARNNYGVLKFANPEPTVLQTIQTLNLHTVFEIYDDLDACLRSMR